MDKLNAKMKKLFAIAALFLASCNSFTNGQSSENLKADDFENKFSSTKDAILLDVRTPAEFSERHLENALNIDYNGNDFEKEVAKLDKSKPVFLYCLSGGRSGNATKLLAKNGFNVYNLEGGILAWANSGKKVVSGGTTAANTIGISLDNYMSLVKKDKLVLVDFNAVWCGPCKVLKPIVERLEKKYSAKMELQKIDVDKNSTLANEMHIESIPLLILYKDGKEIWRQLGLISEKELEAVLVSKF
jgi:thioredoxin 1